MFVGSAGTPPDIALFRILQAIALLAARMGMSCARGNAA
jgi:hypothetical protein